MGKLSQLSEKLKALNLEKEVLTITKEIEPQLIDLNTGQLFSGVNSKGFLLRPPYADLSYGEFKKTLNPKGVVDLKLSGDFYDGFFTNAGKFPIIFSSKDDKTTELENKYGKDIFGLSKNSLEKVIKETILPELQKAVSKAVQL